MLRSCSKCGKIHRYGYICTANKIDYSKYSYKESELRNTYKWHTKAEDIKSRSQYLCSVCLDKGICNYNNLEVHHIIKLKDNSNLLLEDTNLICLCKNCHKLADKGIIDKEYLYKLVKKRENN